MDHQGVSSSARQGHKAPQRGLRAASLVAHSRARSSARSGRRLGTPAATATQQRPAVSMEERMRFLEEDLTHLFDDRGIDQSQYDAVVEFRDPITSYDDAKGYVFNIKMLKKVFNPKFFLHAIRQTGELEATTRWTMVMKPTFIPSFLQGLWDPTLTFTGTSIYGVNPQNGKFNRHLDFWDAVRDNAYFSVEALGHVLVQISILGNKRAKEPPLAHDVWLKGRDWEARRYRPFHAVLSAPGAPQQEQLAGLSRFLDGGNQQQRRLARVSPLLEGRPPGVGHETFLLAPLEAEPSGKGLQDFPAPHPDSGLRLATVPARLLIASYSSEATAEEGERAFHARVRETVARLDGGAAPPRFGMLGALRSDGSELATCSLRQAREYAERGWPRTRWTDLRSVDLTKTTL